jgi:hypothetical protein
MHVQVTFVSIAAPPALPALSRDGTQQATAWTPIAQYSTNAGSGFHRLG